MSMGHSIAEENIQAASLLGSVSGDSPRTPNDFRPGQELQAVILAAGSGRRMQPLSDAMHKALLPVGPTTILGRILDALSAIDVRRIMVVTGYRAGDIEEFIHARGESFDIRFVYNKDYATTNNIFSLSLALDSLEFDTDLLLIECDVLFGREVLERLARHPAPNVALVDRYRSGMDGTVVSVTEGKVTQVFTPSVQGPDFVYADKYKTLNIYRFDREFCRSVLKPLVNAYANHIDSSCYYEVVLSMLSNVPDHRIEAEIVEGEDWIEVDDPNDLDAARFMFEPARRAEILDHAFGGHWNFDIVDFSFMCNRYFPTNAMVAAMRNALGDIVTQYGSAQWLLNEKMAYFLRCDSRRLQVLHGATQAFPILRRLFLGKQVAIPEPSFGEYRRCFPQATTYRDRPGIDIIDLQLIAGSVDVLVVVNPNTPTGTLLDTEALYALAASYPATTFLVDESFLGFSGERSLIELLEQNPIENMVVLCSLSKNLGIPGLRLGYLYTCDPGVNKAVLDELPVWNLSSISEFFMELLLKFRGEFEESIRLTIEDREKFRVGLQRLELVDHVHESGGNFLLVCLFGETSELAGLVRQRLLEENRIEVKNVTSRFPDGIPRLRLAVRKACDNDRLLEAFSAIRGSM